MLAGGCVNGKDSPRMALIMFQRSWRLPFPSQVQEPGRESSEFQHAGKFSEMTAALSQQVLAQLQLVAALGIICVILVLQSAECTRYGIMAASAEISNESLGCQMGLCCEVEVDANGTAEETSEKHSPVM